MKNLFTSNLYKRMVKIVTLLTSVGNSDDFEYIGFNPYTHLKVFKFFNEYIHIRFNEGITFIVSDAITEEFDIDKHVFTLTVTKDFSSIYPMFSEKLTAEDVHNFLKNLKAYLDSLFIDKEKQVKYNNEQLKLLERLSK